MFKLIKIIYFCLIFIFLPFNTWANTAAESSTQKLNSSKQALIKAIKVLDDIQTHLDIEDDKTYEEYRLARKNLASLINQRKQLILDSPDNERKKILGFGPIGVRNIQLELHWISTLSSIFLLRHGWYEFSNDLKLSPMPMLSAIFQLLVALVVFYFWRAWGIPILQRTASLQPIKTEKPINPLLQSIAWRYLQIRSPLEWWLLLSFSLTVASELWSFTNLIPIHIVLNWLLLGRVIIQFVDSLAAARYRRRKRKDEQANLRLKSVKWLGYLFIFTGMLLAEIDAVGLGGGTLEAWISVVLFWAVVPVLLIILRWWRPIVMGKIASDEHSDNMVSQWVIKHSSGTLSLLAVVVGGGYLMLVYATQIILQLAGEREIVRSAMAYMFRIEVARQSAKKKEPNKLQLIDPSYFPEFSLGYTCKKWEDSIAKTELETIAASCESNKSTINVIYAYRGQGKTSFVQRLNLRIKNTLKVVTVQTPAGSDFPALLSALGQAMGMDADTGAKDIAAALKEDEPKVIILDDVHRLIKPCIGGLKELQRLVRFIRRSCQNISWVMTIEASSWQFVSRARGERFLFDLELELPPWQEPQIATLIEMRTQEANLTVSYEGMTVPRQLDALDASEQEQVSRGYARILWEHSKGNPGVALYLWSQSLFKDENDKTLVRLFEIPDTKGLDALSVTLLLVLRATVQLEQAVKVDIANATNLNSDEVADALRLLTSKGYIVRSEDNFYSIYWPWYRAVTTVLKRQHLMIL